MNWPLKKITLPLFLLVSLKNKIDVGKYLQKDIVLMEETLRWKRALGC